MKKKLMLTMVIVCTFMLLFGMINASAETAKSGQCGGNLTWTLDDKGELVINGSGSMWDYDYENSPWCNDVITDVTIGNGVTTIGDYAFQNCTELSNVTIGNNVTAIGINSFYNCTNLISVKLPDSVKLIGWGAFSKCDKLTSVTIPDSVASIGSDAFYECTGLTRVDIKNLIAWYNIDFKSPEANPLYYAHNLYVNGNLLTDLAIPNSLTAIGDYVFSGCSSLLSVTIPDSVTSMGTDAFSSCIGLTSITIPNSITKISNRAFFGCTGLTSITIPNSVASIGNAAFSNCTSLSSITIPNSVASIGNAAFRNCTSLSSIAIPNSVASIGQYAFQNCASLINITIPHNVTSISERTFWDCTGLISITIPASVTLIGQDTFDGCNNLTDVYYDGTEEEWNYISIARGNTSLTNATIHLNIPTPSYPQPEVYKINSVTIKDTSGKELSAIPTEDFLATVSVTNVSSSGDTVIVLAQYTTEGAFKGLMYIQTEDVPTGATIKLSIPVDNKNGDIAKLKALCWKSFSSMTPLGHEVSFPAE